MDATIASMRVPGTASLPFRVKPVSPPQPRRGCHCAIILRSTICNSALSFAGRPSNESSAADSCAMFVSRSEMSGTAVTCPRSEELPATPSRLLRSTRSGRSNGFGAVSLQNLPLRVKILNPAARPLHLIECRQSFAGHGNPSYPRHFWSSRPSSERDLLSKALKSHYCSRLNNSSPSSNASSRH